MMQNQAHTESVHPHNAGKIESKDCFVSVIQSGKRDEEAQRKEFERLFSFDNLLCAYKKAKVNKKSKSSVLDFDANLEINLMRIQKLILSETYVFGPYKEFVVRDPKTRVIASSPFRDRIVHWVLYSYLLEKFKGSFIEHTFGNLTNRGTSAALRTARRFARAKKYRYVLKVDFSKYFYSVLHATLIAQVSKKIKNIFILRTVSNLIGSYRTNNRYDSLFPESSAYRKSKDKGMPIGSLTSQLFANIYLSPLDHFVKDYLGVKAYIRYVDDIVVFCANKERLNEIKKMITSYSSLFLGLTLNPKKISLFPKQKGLSFVGYVIFPQKLAPKKNIKIKIRKRLESGNLASIASTLGYLQPTNHFLLRAANIKLSKGEVYA